MVTPNKCHKMKLHLNYCNVMNVLLDIDLDMMVARTWEKLALKIFCHHYHRQTPCRKIQLSVAAVLVCSISATAMTHCSHRLCILDINLLSICLCNKEHCFNGHKPYIMWLTCFGREPIFLYILINSDELIHTSIFLCIPRCNYVNVPGQKWKSLRL